MRISDCSSDVCSSDLAGPAKLRPGGRLALDGKCDERRVKRDPNAERRGDDHMVSTISLRRERRNARRIKRERFAQSNLIGRRLCRQHGATLSLSLMVATLAWSGQIRRASGGERG